MEGTERDREGLREQGAERQARGCCRPGLLPAHIDRPLTRAHRQLPTASELPSNLHTPTDAPSPTHLPYMYATLSRRSTCQQPRSHRASKKAAVDLGSGACAISRYNST
eukprot:2180031-Rhodomonas_salina.2